MSLIAEDGSGVSGAESYASTTWIGGYWSNRPQNALAATWAAATDANKEGAAREASAYIDAIWGPYYRGVRRGWVQGLLWPRSDAMDDAQALGRPAYPLPDLPPCLMQATAELAARALSARLAQDLARGGMVSTLKAGSVEIQYAAGAPAQKTYGLIDRLLAPILNGSQPNAPNPHWTWA